MILVLDLLEKGSLDPLGRLCGSRHNSNKGVWDNLFATIKPKRWVLVESCLDNGARSS